MITTVMFGGEVAEFDALENAGELLDLVALQLEEITELLDADPESVFQHLDRLHNVADRVWACLTDARDEAPLELANSDGWWDLLRQLKEVMPDDLQDGGRWDVQQERASELLSWVRTFLPNLCS